MRERTPSALVLASLALLAAAVLARAQFSPGPLSAAHEHLDGNRNCFRCHGLGKEDRMDDRCLECHKEIAHLIDRGRGLHAANRADCAVCHAEHAGREFLLIDPDYLEPGVFDHAATGYPLEGKHISLKCESCHRADRVDPEVASLRPGALRTGSHIGLPTDCAACHEDPHRARLGTRCADCHNEKSFHDVDAAAFEHDKTRYTLRGAHVKAECRACHDPKEKWGARPPFETCVSCHGEAHGRQFEGSASYSGADCSACHDESSFRSSSFTAVRHEAAGFALRGRHAGVACSGCHPKETGGAEPERAGSARILFRVSNEECRSCHEDPHRGEFAERPGGGRCESCHGEEGWSPSRFTREEHRSARMALDGRHAEIECRACHARGAEAAGEDGAAGKWAFRFENLGCAACHIDPHEGRYDDRVIADRTGKVCTDCHDLRAFRPSTIDVAAHAGLGYELKGAHRAVPCLACHEDLRTAVATGTLVGRSVPVSAIRFASKHDACGDCHKGPHGTQFDEDCGACHASDRFKPASLFDHEKDSSFQLAGAHARASCGDCHKGETMHDGTVRVRYRPLSAKCESCHALVPGTGEALGTESSQGAPPSESGEAGK